MMQSSTFSRYTELKIIIYSIIFVLTFVCDIVCNLSCYLLQEIIDMCDYAVGLSRQLNGSIIPSERKIFHLYQLFIVSLLIILRVIKLFKKNFVQTLLFRC